MKVGRYDVIAELKSGGMGKAPLARVPDGQRVVLKVPLVDDAELFARLRDEARVGAAVHHPNLVKTLDCFVDERTRDAMAHPVKTHVSSCPTDHFA